MYVSLLNHVAHSSDQPDNGYEKDGKGGYIKINDKGGDTMDYLYENGEIIASRTPFQIGGEVSHQRTYGVLSNKGTGGSLSDPSFDIALSLIPVARGLNIFKYFKFLHNGITITKGPGYGAQPRFDIHPLSQPSKPSRTLTIPESWKGKVPLPHYHRGKGNNLRYHRPWEKGPDGKRKW